MSFVIARTPLLQESYSVGAQEGGTPGGGGPTCPITQERLFRATAAAAAASATAAAPSCAVLLASDGRLYDAEALQQWVRQCESRRKPPTSPITREVLRPWARLVVVAAAQQQGTGGEGVSSQRRPGIVRLGSSWGPPYSLHTPRLGGVVQMAEWDDRAGVATRMLLGWEDGDALEWQMPLVHGSPPLPATPPPCAPLLPMLAPILRWWGGGGTGAAGLHLAFPAHLLTAPVRVVSDEGAGPWTTVEECLLRLNVAP